MALQVPWVDWLASRRAEQAARLMTLVLAVLVVYLVARIAWLLVPSPEPEVTAADEPPGIGATPRTGVDRSVDTARLAGWHLFGEAPVPAPDRDAAPIDAPETRLNLTLRGLYATDDRDRARAIVAAPDGREQTYRIGDDLPGGAELSEIYADRIILLRNGRHETLRLPREELGDGAMRAGGETGVSPRAAAILQEYRTLLETNPRSLIDLVRPVPTQENNRFVGFRLYPGNRPELFQELGLRPGDLVMQVNGIVLDSAAKGVQVLQSLRQNEAVNMQIRRGQQELNLSFQLS